MTDPTTALALYLLPGILYGGWCLYDLKRQQGVPFKGVRGWRNLILVVGAWPLVALMVAVAKARRWFKRAYRVSVRSSVWGAVE